jgi:uncharacterized protein YqiB (DUF1249 family)
VQHPIVEPGLQRILAAPTSVGALLELCEENFQLLRLIAPDLRAMRGSHHSRRAGQLDLHLDILGQSPYTTTLRLTYYFDEQQGRAPDPDATLRVYHDARQLEVLDLRQQALPVERLFERPGLARKWKASVFLSKWLWFCLRNGHRFEPKAHPDSAGQDGPAGSAEAPAIPVRSAG